MKPTTDGEPGVPSDEEYLWSIPLSPSPCRWPGNPTAPCFSVVSIKKRKEKKSDRRGTSSCGWFSPRGWMRARAKLLSSRRVVPLDALSLRNVWLGTHQAASRFPFVSACPLIATGKEFIGRLCNNVPGTYCTLSFSFVLALCMFCRHSVVRCIAAEA